MKKLLLTIVFLLMGFINFGYCEFTCSPITAGGIKIQGNSFGSIGWDIEGTEKGCVISNDGTMNIEILGNTYVLHKNESICINKSEIPNGISTFPITCNSSSCGLGWVYFGGDCVFMSSLECQTEYNLIPISSVNQDYCVNNGLCPSSECPDIPIGTGNWSALYINNIQHLSAPIINVDIPEEFDWDYTNTGGVFDLTIDGYNTDSDYIAGIITTQNSKPTNEDLNNIITNVIPLFVPGLVIILFIYFVFRFLKKIF